MPVQRIFLTGGHGMLGRELTAFLTAKGYEVTAPASETFNLLHTADALRAQIEAANPQLILHSAAYTNVDGAEAEPELAMAINKDGTAKLADIARELDCLFMLIGSDYVFDGAAERPYRVDDRPNPISVYGWSKYYAELMVTERLDTYYIVRTSWTYGIHKSNFVQWVLDRVRAGQTLRVIEDQWGSPTWTGSLCHQLDTIIQSGRYGIYHGADRGVVSRYEQAKRICKAAGLSPDYIQPIPQADFPQAARRPRYSPLDPGELAAPTWETALAAYVEQYLSRYVPDQPASIPG